MTDTQDQFRAPESIGTLLRSMREQRGETLADVAHVLKLSVRQVDALEREDFDALPGPAFVRGFLRNYARYMQLDVESRIAELEFGGENRGVRLAAVSNASGEIPNGGLRARLGLKPVFGLLVGMAVVLGLGWNFDWFKLDGDKPVVTAPDSQVVAPAPVERSASGGSVAPGTVAPPSFLVLPGTDSMPLGDGLSQDDAAPEGADPEATAPAGAEAAADDTAFNDADLESEVDEVSEAVLVTSADISPSEADTGRLTFKLGAESWIQVRDRDGTALYTGTGAAGTTRVVQGNPPFTLVVGNAGRVDLDLDGRVIDMTPHISPGGVARLTVQ